MKPSEILEEAALHLRKVGHAKGRHFANDALFSRTSRCCIIGAIIAVKGQGARTYFESKLLQRVGATANCNGTADGPAAWNDMPSTTHGAAFNALWAAARIAREAGE